MGQELLEIRRSGDISYPLGALRPKRIFDGSSLSPENGGVRIHPKVFQPQSFYGYDYDNNPAGPPPPVLIFDAVCTPPHRQNRNT